EAPARHRVGASGQTGICGGNRLGIMGLGERLAGLIERVARRGRTSDRGQGRDRGAESSHGGESILAIRPKPGSPGPPSPYHAMNAQFATTAALAAACLMLIAGPAQAYIGPGAGFAFVGSFMVLITTFVLAFAIILTWPIRMVYRLIAVGNPYRHAQSKR